MFPEDQNTHIRKQRKSMFIVNYKSEIQKQQIKKSIFLANLEIDISSRLQNRCFNYIVKSIFR